MAVIAWSRKRAMAMTSHAAIAAATTASRARAASRVFEFSLDRTVMIASSEPVVLYVGEHGMHA